MSHFALPSVSGSYRWYYVDLTAGDFTAVVIFMIGSLFSPRYSSALRKGASPRQHAAVNFALYEKGVRRQWVLSEYQDVTAEGQTLKIGESTLHARSDGSLVVQVIDTTAIWGKPVEARLELTPEGPGHAPIRLVEGLDHWWQPIAPRARATLTMPKLGLKLEGRGYHDGNHGEVPLGSDLRGWDWVRSHASERTTITYRPWNAAASWQVAVDENSVAVNQVSLPPAPSSRTAWGLSVPKLQESRLLESSPFYARLESGRDTLGEAADFQRFHSPWIRWMAGLRTRVAS
ncbi:MAG: carotenoid 1,2-hydratase [Archangium sp.]|nr:carotenoid 1,2-hydratase [Archangium sp.]